jgi:hypothetical protein
LLPAADYLRALEEDYQMAVKDGILKHRAGTQQGAAQLEAVGIRPLVLPQPVPEQGCINVQQLPSGTEVEGEDGFIVDARDLPLQPFRAVVAEVNATAMVGTGRLLEAMQQYSG